MDSNSRKLQRIKYKIFKSNKINMPFNTTLWIHQMDADKTQREKARHLHIVYVVFF